MKMSYMFYDTTQERSYRTMQFILEEELIRHTRPGGL
jgi:hypothetical protein